MTMPLKPKRGGSLRAFGCGWFIREFLLGHAPNGAATVKPNTSAPQADIFHQYKLAIIRATAEDKAARSEEKRARREKRIINPDNIQRLAEHYVARLPYKAHGCRYHSFVVYFSVLQRLSWVEPSGKEEPSSFQSNYPPGPPRKYFRVTAAGRQARDADWANPQAALYRAWPSAEPSRAPNIKSLGTKNAPRSQDSLKTMVSYL